MLRHVSSHVSGFPLASPCRWGKLQNLSFSKVSKQVVTPILRGRRGTSWHFHVFDKGVESRFCVAGAALGQHFAWQAQHFRRVMLRVFCESQCQSGLGQVVTTHNLRGSLRGSLCGRHDMLWHAMTLHTLHSTLHTLHFQIRTLHSTLYTLHSTLYTSHSTLHTLHSTLYIPHSTQYTPHSTLYMWHSTRHTLHSTLHTPHFRLHSPHSTLYTPHFTLYILHSTLHTLHFTFHTPHFTLYTPHPTL